MPEHTNEDPEHISPLSKYVKETERQNKPTLNPVNDVKTDGLNNSSVMGRFGKFKEIMMDSKKSSTKKEDLVPSIEIH